MDDLVTLDELDVDGELLETTQYSSRPLTLHVTKGLHLKNAYVIIQIQ